MRRTRTGVRPFLKWAGGKTQLLPRFRSFYPDAFGRYFEPFLGSGAVFLDLHGSGRLAGRPAVLTDTNLDVIGCHVVVRDALDVLVRHLTDLAEGHRRRGSAHFYEVRDKRFNPLRQRFFTAGAGPDAYPPELAAMLLYLNRTGYNGLFRLNSKGLFNVPAGRYANPRICDADNLRRVAEALRRPDVTLGLAPFDAVLDLAEPGDFLYFDPPYAPVSATSRFTAYTAAGFGPDDQARLQVVVVELARRGCQIMLSNSAAPHVEHLYQDHPGIRGSGLRLVGVAARRAINSRPQARGPIREFLVTNLPERA